MATRFSQRSGRPRLRDAVAALSRLYGKPARPRVTDPFAMAVWENVAYLVDDERRAAVFERLEDRGACEPEAILEMPGPALADLIRDGGMHPDRRAEKLHRAAEVVLDVGRSALRTAVREDPARAKRLLKKLPGFGEPGAEKVLLFNRAWKGLAPDSNALRVLVRLGFGEEGKDYRRTYRSAGEAVAPELPDDAKWLVEAHLLLRRHGRETCKSSAPACGACPLADECRWLGEHGGR